MKSFEHGGNIHLANRQAGGARKILDFSANINPLGPPEWFRPLVSGLLSQLVHYPDPDNLDFVQAVCRFHSVQTHQVICGNGTTELLYTTLQAIDCTRVVIPVPSYVDYIRAAEVAGRKVEFLRLREDDDFALNMGALSESLLGGETVIIGSPNNPTGNVTDPKALADLAAQHPDTVFLLDEAFLDFVPEVRSLAGAAENIVTLHSMTKFYGLPGLRLGYGVYPERLVDATRSRMLPWSVNTLAQAVGAKALADTEYQNRTRAGCRVLREGLVADLKEIDVLKIFQGTANYLLCKLPGGQKADKLANFLKNKGILIRQCDNYRGLEEADRFFRIAVRTEKENRRLVDVLRSYFGKDRKKAHRLRKKTPAIMFQGTCSDAGKSLMTAALCRILVQDGVSVVPFKAQNMSLNSFVTHDGLEMGRAQVVQAQAARRDPDVRMNPILLKPNSDTGSQVIVCGKPVGNMSVREYDRYKPRIWEKICGVYDSLAAEAQVVILEGAGSPGEVNLKADDIVNMRMADYAESPVILVGDIDRGGVYASFVGILEVMAEWERDLIAGFLVNKFRGQESLLGPAHEYVKLHTGKEVLGVLPYLANLGLPQEDSVSFKKGLYNRIRSGEVIDIGLVNLPHISNFTDVEPFLDEPDVTLRVVDSADALGTPDAIILPGSKNVISDLEELKQNGLGEAILRCHQEGSIIVGICGGYQMLGRLIKDPYQIESAKMQVDGLGLLRLDTVIEKEKRLTRKTGVHTPSGKPVVGYEIHHGVSAGERCELLQFDDGSTCGTMNDDATVWGSYLHGIFDADEFRRWFIDKLRIGKGLEATGKVVAPYNLESGFDRLASSFRSKVDMETIYSLLKL